MAKKRKTKKKTTGKRRVSGAKAGSPIENILWGVGGAIAGGFVRKFTPDKLGSMVKTAAPMILPVGVYFLSPNTLKDPRAMAFAIGMGSYGGVGLVNQLAPNLLSGLGGNPSMIAGYNRMLSGHDTANEYYKAPMVSGSPSMVAGMGFSMEEVFDGE